MAWSRSVDDHAEAVGTHPPQPAPVLLVVVDQQGAPRLTAQVGQPLQLRRPLGFGVYGQPDGVPSRREHDRHEVGRTVRTNGRQPSDGGGGEARAQLRYRHRVRRVVQLLAAARELLAASRNLSSSRRTSGPQGWKTISVTPEFARPSSLLPTCSAVPLSVVASRSAWPPESHAAWSASLSSTQ